MLRTELENIDRKTLETIQSDLCIIDDPKIEFLKDRFEGTGSLGHLETVIEDVLPTVSTLRELIEELYFNCKFTIRGI